jgi:hypothetical protein
VIDSNVCGVRLDTPPEWLKQGRGRWTGAENPLAGGAGGLLSTSV